MSSDPNNLMDSGFTIPKKIPKKKRGGEPAAQGSEAPPPRSSRKVLPTRTSRIAEEKLSSPEWEAMSKLLQSFYTRADCGEIVYLVYSCLN